MAFKKTPHPDASGKDFSEKLADLFKQMDDGLVTIAEPEPHSFYGSGPAEDFIADPPPGWVPTVSPREFARCDGAGSELYAASLISPQAPEQLLFLRYGSRFAFPTRFIFYREIDSNICRIKRYVVCNPTNCVHAPKSFFEKRNVPLTSAAARAVWHAAEWYVRSLEAQSLGISNNYLAFFTSTGRRFDSDSLSWTVDRGSVSDRPRELAAQLEAEIDWVAFGIDRTGIDQR